MESITERSVHVVLHGPRASQPGGQPISVLSVDDEGRVPEPQLAGVPVGAPLPPVQLPPDAVRNRVLSLQVEADSDLNTFLVATPKDASAAFVLGAQLRGRLQPGDVALIAATVAFESSLVPPFLDGLVMGKDPLPDPADEQVTLTVQVAHGATVEASNRQLAFSRGSLLARRVATTPSNVKTPDWLAAQAQSLVKGQLTVKTLDAKTLTTADFGGVLAVGQGSANPPNVTVLEYRNYRRTRPKVIVGKGITFDSGGLSLKPLSGMVTMKSDMGGAAAVLGAFSILRELHPPISAVGVIGCAENMPDGAAMRPGDIIRHYGGRTSEVLNTDAEGRLVLADCLAFAKDMLRPKEIVDIATLTGAATLGLGRGHAALYSDDEDLAAELAAAGDRGGEATWRMPLVDDYESAIESDVADAANTNTDAHTHGGSITAALFLRPFAGGTPWAHLDIAGTGRREAKEPGKPKGPTGYGARVLAEWLMES